MVPTSEDRQGYLRRLTESSPRLFVSRQEWLEVVRLLPDTEGEHLFESLSNRQPDSWCHIDFEHHVIEDIDSLVQQIDINRHDTGQCFYFIPQEFTWGRFRTSQRAFQTILASHCVFAPLLDLVHAFGLKTQENHHVRAIFHNHISPDATEGYYYEICYNLHYMAKNGRNRGDPWSLRQTGVYQKSYLSTGRSAWMLMQLAADTRIHLEEKLKSGGAPTQNLMQFHTLILLSTGRNWTDYLEHLDAQLTELDEKSCFSRLPHNPASGPNFPITLSDLQCLQLLRQKLLRTSTVLDQCFSLSQSLSSHSSLLSSHIHAYSHQALNADILSYLTIIDSCRRSINSIILRSEGTSSLLTALLTSAHHHHLHITSLATNSTLSLCRNLLSQTHEESAVLSNVARQGREDSKILKALTLISTLYLPASLVATVFGSGGLMQWSEVGGGGKWHVVVAGGFWIYVVVTMGLMGVTMGVARWLWRRG